MRSIDKKYMDALSGIPAPGRGCHAALLGVANLGIMAVRDDNTILSEIRDSIPAGKRKVADREIMDAVRRAHKDTIPFDANVPPPRPVQPRRSPAEELAAILKGSPEKAEKLKSRIIDAGDKEVDLFGADVWEASAIRIQPSEKLENCPYAEDGIQLLNALYHPEDILYIGSQKESGQEQQNHVKPVSEWTAFFQEQIAKIAAMPESAQMQALQRLGDAYPLIIPNPLSGRRESTKDGEKQTLRGDACVQSFRFMVLESDSLSFPQQGALLRGICRLMECKVCAVIYSGGKSCHAWVRLDGISNLDEWEKEVKGKIFAVLGKIGFDGACCNAARLSRFAGMFRRDKEKFQRLLYLAPEGGVI